MKSGRGTKPIASTAVDDATTGLQKKTSSGLESSSVRGITQSLDMHVSTLNKMLLNILHSYPFWISHVQKLHHDHLLVWQTSAIEFLVHIQLDNEQAMENFLAGRRLFPRYFSIQNCRPLRRWRTISKVFQYSEL